MFDSVKRVSLQVLVLALASSAAVQTWRLQGDQLEASEAKSQRATQQSEHERLARVASETNRQLERQYRDQVSEIETRAQADLAQSRLAVDRARDAGQCQADTSPAVDLLAELFRRADQRAGELAAIADEARVRGLACEAGVSGHESSRSSVADMRPCYGLDAYSELRLRRFDDCQFPIVLLV